MYKRNADNRASLFGGGGGGDDDKKKQGGGGGGNDDPGRNSLFGFGIVPLPGGGGGGSEGSDGGAGAQRGSGGSNNQGYSYFSWMSGPADSAKKKNVLKGEARDAAMKAAEENRKKANKCMEKSFFKSPDPIMASTYYKRAADNYARVGDQGILERTFRVEAAQCNMSIGVYNSAAVEYIRAAELCLHESDDMPDIEQKRSESSKYYKLAAAAFWENNEKAKSGEYKIKSALCFTFRGPDDENFDDDDNDGKYDDDIDIEGNYTFTKESITAIEEAVETFVPDVFNPYARYRQTGHSAYVDPNSEEETVENPSRETLQMAREHIATRSHSHEILQEVVVSLVNSGEYATALYATGAASVLLEEDGISTLTLGRSYVVETIITLALGDPVQAEQQYLDRHVQRSSYLSSRECKLAEELYRAVKRRDQEELDEVRDHANGKNKSALNNLHPAMQSLVRRIRVSGIAKVKEEKPAFPILSSIWPFGGGGEDDNNNKPAPIPEQSKPKSRSAPAGGAAAASANKDSLKDVLNMKTGYEDAVREGSKYDADDLQAELDDLDFGDDDDEDDDDGLGGLEDDDIDLR